MALPNTLQPNDLVSAAPLMANFNYLEEQNVSRQGEVSVLTMEQVTALQHLHGNGVVPGYLNELAPSIQGTSVSVDTGMAYIQGARVSCESAKTVSFAGKPSNTYYVLLDSAGELTAETTENPAQLTMCSVVWNGSSLSNLVDRRSFFPRPSELKKLYGTSPNVTATALNELTGGGQTSLHSHLVAEGSPVNAKAASGTITFDSQVSDGDTVTIGGRAYRFKDSLAQAYDVKIGVTKEETADNLKRAINDEGVEGTNYGTGTAPHATVAATINGAIVTVTAKTKGAAGNSITLTKSAANITLSGATLTGGQDGTPGTPGELRRDTQYLYVCVGTQTVNDDNWRRIALGVAY